MSGKTLQGHSDAGKRPESISRLVGNGSLVVDRRTLAKNKRKDRSGRCTATTVGLEVGDEGILLLFVLPVIFQ